MKLVAYKPQFYYLLQSALEDEGLTCTSFDKDHTMIVEKDGRMIGFFSFQFKHGVPQMNHFLLFRKHRGFNNMRSLCKAFALCIGAMGYSLFIVAVPDSKKYFSLIGRFWSKDYCFLSREKDQEYYLVPVCGRGI